MSTAIVWFKNDLRLHDHEALHNALKQNETVLPFYCFEQTQLGSTSFGFEKTGSHRAQFLIESVRSLKESLAAKGSDLIVRRGNTAEELARVIKEHHVDRIYTFKEFHDEEIKIQCLVEELGIPIEYSFGCTLFHVNDLPHAYQETPKQFTAFRKGVEKKSTVREEYPEPQSLPQLPKHTIVGSVPTLSELNLKEGRADKRAVLAIKGGEHEALKRLEHYFYETRELSLYKKKRNGLLGANYSSKLSLWLWNGCISPRRIYWEVKKYEKSIAKNQSTYWLIFELIWRDYFKFIALKYGTAIFKLGGIKKEKGKWSRDKGRFERWANGETGIPFIDANMRELNRTGFMSNRGRQNVASFLVTELGLDWRMGAEYFESKLIDYDVASNYGNWMYVAGVGNDPRDRYFNIMLQAKRYDPQGKYVKHWLPELTALDASQVHHPWTTQGDLFQEKEYPQPMVEPGYWKKHY